MADATRGQTDLRTVRAIVADAVQHGKCTVGQLAAELAAGPKQGSAAMRTALADVAAGADSAAEADFINLIKRSGLPEPMYNHKLFIGSEFLAKPDAWWPTAGVPTDLLVQTGWHDYRHTAPRRRAHLDQPRPRPAQVGAVSSRVN